MLLSFAGTSMLSAFFCMCFRHWSLRLVVARRYMSWTCPSESLGCSSDGHEPTADGGVLFNLGIRCSSWGMTGSRRCSLAVLDSWHPWWTLSFMTPLWDCFNCCHAVFSGPLLPNSSAKLCRSGCDPSVAGALACPMICGIFFLFFTIPAGLHVKKRVKCQKSMVTTYLCHPIASELS